MPHQRSAFHSARRTAISRLPAPLIQQLTLAGLSNRPGCWKRRRWPVAITLTMKLVLDLSRHALRWITAAKGLPTVCRTTSSIEVI